MTIGESTKPVKINESVYIPLKEKHALANEGEELMQLIEVQSGITWGKTTSSVWKTATAEPNPPCQLEFDNLNLPTTAN